MTVIGNETYLGDGVYASFDGFHIKLRASRFDMDHEIWLEPAALHQLGQFVARITIQVEADRAVEKIEQALRQSVVREEKDITGIVDT